ncbi:hypothetical protein CEXT_153181 [Caerostris extrusa]|uniref:Uncharacterized protein n=1 Tax=Caerostris extrusa TaxID=172846 RepID=A0AAV4NYA9_CAEEX|nr:hypothetical protein CEXT_153181 [Caerostris extrusa]
MCTSAAGDEEKASKKIRGWGGRWTRNGGRFQQFREPGRVMGRFIFKSTAVIVRHRCFGFDEAKQITSTEGRNWLLESVLVPFARWQSAIRHLANRVPEMRLGPILTFPWAVSISNRT